MLTPFFCDFRRSGIFLPRSIKIVGAWLRNPPIWYIRKCLVTYYVNVLNEFDSSGVTIQLKHAREGFTLLVTSVTPVYYRCVLWWCLELWHHFSIPARSDRYNSIQWVVPPTHIRAAGRICALRFVLPRRLCTVFYAQLCPQDSVKEAIWNTLRRVGMLSEDRCGWDFVFAYRSKLDRWPCHVTVSEKKACFFIGFCAVTCHAFPSWRNSTE